MDESKLLGPDGIIPKVFQMFWPQIGQLVTLALLRFLNSGVILKEWNNTHIILIPKVEKPELISQYPPINLCNVIYRLASKCLANRLKLVISSIVSESQQAFVPSRLMSDGCLITKEIMHYLNKTKKGSASYAALKLDMHKAFDRVSWPFLIAIMKKFGFLIFWQNIIWECISTVTYNIVINGKPSSTFRPSCGLRQGDPLSPYLFIMCMEILSCQLRTAEKTSTLHGLNISRPNAPIDFKSHMASILKMRTSDCFGNYLGVPVDLPSKKSLAFHPLVDKMTTCIIAWSSLHLSQPCKLLIINSIILGSIRFLMTSIPFPIGICKKLDSLIAYFWWRKDVRHRSIHWLSRDSLQLPLESGGLGLKSVSLLGQTSLTKNFWRIHHHPSGLLSKFMTPKYRKDLPIPASKSKVSHPSFLWAGLCRAANAFSPGFSWKLGNGSSVNLFTSPWVNGNTPSVRLSSAAAMPDLSNMLTASGNWDPFTVYRWFQSPCANAILAMEPPHIDIDDFLYWKYTEDGVYTVRSGYDFLLSHISFSCSPSFYSAFPWKVLWSLRCSPKFTLLVWRIVHNILPSLENLSVRGIQLTLVFACNDGLLILLDIFTGSHKLQISAYFDFFLAVLLSSYSAAASKLSIPTLDCALPFSVVTYFIPVCMSSLQDRFMHNTRISNLNLEPFDPEIEHTLFRLRKNKRGAIVAVPEGSEFDDLHSDSEYSEISEQPEPLNMARETRTLRELTAPNLNVQPLCITFPALDDGVTFELKSFDTSLTKFRWYEH
ncbi:uncharacterized protein LOC141632198 [Silene latifolia]|uniref:uncharacterized protein LOC141632198 n=1 Tax=Silene latifolia TaxID=37657 RepID=UPI003D7754E8